MYTTEKFRQQVYSWYKDNGITVGDPNEGVWENAHIVPRCGGGTETILLLKGHHYIHDLYQSREYNRCCFHGRTKVWLYGEGFLCENWFELVELCEYYNASHCSEVSKEYWSTLTREERVSATATSRARASVHFSSLGPEGRSAKMRSIRKAGWAALTPEERSAEMSRRVTLAWERRRSERALRSLGDETFGAMWSADTL